MNWEAANVKKSRSADDAARSKQSAERRSTETVEAALSRLSKAYTTSMECIGSLHKMNKMVQKENGDSSLNDVTSVLKRVSNAARRTLEFAILIDPLIIPHAATVNQTIQELATSSSSPADRWRSVTEKRPVPPVLSSAAHKAKIGELAYLALVNYADLLVSCCVRVSSKTICDEQPILDRGVVRKIESLESNGQCCWSDEESHEDIQRLALTALCDASNLDASDPILWLKIACAARGLERIVHERNDSMVLTTKYRRLQRYALERGSSVLPPSMPPNRTIARALKELDNSTFQTGTYESVPMEKEEPMEVVLELPRYSWSIFGRMIVRACREGSDFQAEPKHYSTGQVKPSIQFGSPVLILRLNPLFVLPPNLLGRICGYLDVVSVVRFESTCRGIAFSMINAKSSTQEDKTKTQGRKETNLEKEEHANSKSKSDKSIKDGDKKEAAKDSGKNEKEQESTQSHRTSKRLRSQQITSGKLAERKAHRQSFTYCFLAATMACTKSEFQKNVDKVKENISNTQDDGTTSKLEKASRNDVQSMSLQETKERLGAASLSTFVDRWSGYNNGPIDVLLKFLSHIAMNVQEVFACDPRGPLELIACILSGTLTAETYMHIISSISQLFAISDMTIGFEHCIRRSGSHQGLVPRFFRPVQETGCVEKSLELLALDLLYAELTLRQCDRYVPTHVEFDDDSNMIQLMVSALLDAFDDLSYSFKGSNLDAKLYQTFTVFSIRCHWLAAGFFLWRSRVSRAIFESREAEDEALYFIEETAKLFDSPLIQSSSILTPHLVSLGRSEPYWKEVSPQLLTKFRDELQASSVVSMAKQKYQELVDQFERVNANTSSSIVPEESAKMLSDIGESLFERYKSSYDDPKAKHIELVEDFLAIHGEELKSLANVAPLKEGNNEITLNPIPLGTFELNDLFKMSNPSILSILLICLNMSKRHQLDITQLLIRLVLTTIDHHSLLLDRILTTQGKRRQGFGGDNEGDFSDSDDDSVFSDDGSIDRNATNKNADEMRVRQCGYFVVFLLKCISISFSKNMNVTESLQLYSSNDFSEMIRSTMELAADWFRLMGRRWEAADDIIDEALFQAIRHLTAELRITAQETSWLNIERVYFAGMMKTVISHRYLLMSMVKMQGSRVGLGRSARQRLCVKRARFLSMICSEMGYILSLNQGDVQGLRVIESELLRCRSNPTEDDSLNNENKFSEANRLLFYDALLVLWKYASMTDSESGSKPDSTATCSAFDRPVVKELKIPIVGLIVGLCGSATRTRSQEESRGKDSPDCNAERTDPLCLTEFFDSDASVHEWLSDSDEDGDKRELLRAICHSVHSINRVMSVVDDKAAISTFSEYEQRDKIGPLLPIISTRVLNHFADSLLLNFGALSNERENLWAKEYPFTTQTIGELLDSLLRKSYSWLHGFSLVGEKGHQSTGKDAVTSTTTVDSNAKAFEVESTVAAAQLYRCIVRAYASGRRSPPKASLEMVSSALPPLEQSAKSKLLREFMFSTSEAELGLADITQLLKKDVNWDTSFKKIQSQLGMSDEGNDSEGYSLANDVMRVRRGICGQLASGQLPSSVSDAGKNKSDQGPEDERLLSTRQEEEISKKFSAIFDDLCLGDINNCKGWYRAAQCLVAKAELIADRLGLSLGFDRNTDFSIPVPRPKRKESVFISVLEAEQEDEDTRMNKSWISHLGKDLSIYTEHSWSSFDSLISCSSKISKQLEEDMEIDNSRNSPPSQSVAWREIEAMYNSGNFLQWQEAWGGIFVGVLRKLALRFTCTGLFILQSKSSMDAEDRILMSEIIESIGISHYSELMGSQAYGYPMHIMSQKRKRNLAHAAKMSFQAALDIVEHDGNDEGSENDDSSDARVTWDLLFMIGKCDEKIAKTYCQEGFSSTTRKYEQYMASAMSSYSKALKQAEAIENDVGFDGQNGGSAHGYTEVLYRLHASRLKCLISAASHNGDELQLSEAESLRLTEGHFYTKQDTESPPDSKDHRDRIWNVLCDIVSALVKCRSNHSFFHRSVYRHAQALMWSPILCDPSSNEGSLGTVPIHLSCHLRGLNASHAANSAEVVMSTLFDKKRTQICGVWVTTTTAPSPFEILNNSTRKFDLLRAKYICAYIESLRLCKQRTELEQLIKLLSSSKRDLPSYFQASGLLGGKVPDKKHEKDCLLNKDDSLKSLGFLVSVKRQANSAFAEIMLKSITDDDITSNGRPKSPEMILKHAYACYLRLHCDPKDLRKTKAMKYGVGSISEVELLCQAYLNSGMGKKESSLALDNDWSGVAQKSAIFKDALEKCQSLFPSLSGNFLFRHNAKIKEKGPTGSSSNSNNNNNKPGGKRKASAESSLSSPEKTSKLSFEVSVPENLVTGDTFLTSVKYGDNQTKQVRLTVPEGNPSTLRFTLKVPLEG